MKVVINKAEHKVRHNYLHRGIPRLILEVKAMGQYCAIQFNVQPDRIEYGKEYEGYFCSKMGNIRTVFTIKK